MSTPHAPNQDLDPARQVQPSLSPNVHLRNESA